MLVRLFMGHLLYRALTQNVAVYLFYVVPIAYFASIIIRLVYYKLKYHHKLLLRDVMAAATMLVIVLDYTNFLYLFVTGTGERLPIGALFIKYTLGFLLWMWMFWYSYKVHLKRSLTRKNLKKHSVVIAYVFSMLVILVVIAIVVSR